MTIWVSIGIIASEQDLSSHVGNGSSSRDFDGDGLSILKGSSIEFSNIRYSIVCTSLSL